VPYPPPPAQRLRLALIAGCLTAVALYGLLRVVQLVLFPEPNPATVIWSAHAGYFWRAWTVAYTGGMAAFVAYLASGRAPGRVARVLGAALVPCAVILTVQAVFFP
jgi:choline-glycine betaine transporter